MDIFSDIETDEFASAEEIESKVSEEEQQFICALNRLSEISNPLKNAGFSIDTIFEQKETDRLHQYVLQKQMSKKQEVESCFEIAKSWAEGAEQCFTKISNLLRPNNIININYKIPRFRVTYLHTAAGMGSLRLVKLLLQRNPDPNLLNCFDQTPADRARQFARSAEVAEVLLDYQATYNAEVAANTERAVLFSKTGQFRHNYRKEFMIDMIDNEYGDAPYILQDATKTVQSAVV